VSPTLIGGAIVVALLGLQTWRLSNAHEELGAVEAKFEVQIVETQQAVAANKLNNSQIDKLATQIVDMVESRRLEGEERDRVIAANNEDLVAARAVARRLEGERDDIFRGDLGCAAMGAIRVDTACPLIAIQLRERTSRARSDRDADSGSAGGGSPPST